MTNLKRALAALGFGLLAGGCGTTSELPDGPPARTETELHPFGRDSLAEAADDLSGVGHFPGVVFELDGRDWDFDGIPGPTVPAGASGVLNVHSPYYADRHVALTISERPGEWTFVNDIPLVATGLTLLSARWQSDSTGGVLDLGLRHPEGLQTAMLDSLQVEFFDCGLGGCLSGGSFHLILPPWEALWNAGDTTGKGRIALQSPTWPTSFPLTWTVELNVWFSDRQQRGYQFTCTSWVQPTFTSSKLGCGRRNIR